MDAPAGSRQERRSAVSEFDAAITFCYTEDLIETARFYEDLLGLPLAVDQHRCRIYKVSDGAFIAFCARPEAPSPEGVILTLVTENVDGWYERLSGAGVRFEKAPCPNPDYHIYHCFLRDPSGYLVEIQRFDDPGWRNAG